MLEKLRTADPQAVGEILLHARNLFPNSTLAQVADSLDFSDTPSVDPNMSMQTVATEEYWAHIMERADNGDKFAQRILDGDGPLIEGNEG